MELSAVKTDKNVLTYKIDERVKAGDTFSFLLMSDVHIDSTKCDRALLKKHLRQAKDKGAGVFIFGDLFDIMQGRNDRRSNKMSMDPGIFKKMLEEKREYYDAACQLAVEFFTPYKDNMKFVSYGNHETAINRHNEFDILQRFATALEMETGTYEGYVKFMMNAKRAATILLKYHHGYGGAKRSKGILDSQLFAFLYPDADICVRGHNHYKFLDTNSRERVSNRGRSTKSKQYYVNLGTYKDKDPGMGWETEKGFYPPTLGGWWMDIELKANDGGGIAPKIKIYEAD